MKPCSALEAWVQGGSEGVVASTPGMAGLVPAHVQRTPSAWAQTAKTRHQDELEEAGSSSSDKQPGRGAGEGLPHNLLFGCMFLLMRKRNEYHCQCTDVSCGQSFG